MDKQRCSGTAFISISPSADTHRTFVIHTDRVFIICGGRDDGELDGIGQGRGLSSTLSPQWQCMSSGWSWGHQGPLCASNHQVVSDGAVASRSQNGCRFRRGWGGGEEKRVQEWNSLEFSQKRQRVLRRRKERKKKEAVSRHGSGRVGASVLVSQVHCTRNVLRCDDSIGLEPSMKQQRQKLHSV